ncbi:carbohydrate-binding protein [Neobacillus massiliamazoniensis]|uniref:Purple acid phosphatase/fibronectin domain-containing protein n=1 Tax=Neobacillus massiliamazoniensis TaxID=1499688 RepID=A0A0U1NST3_9BACI|nr:carbohydrate-binding protein [Neobacillus massiliamazoniensis]CRK81119.1 purple acid phosphatase/fibronectin domain-containing protein [Neobacillus massiliamazoniensis]
MVTLAKFYKIFFSFILIVSYLLSSSVGYMAVHAASDGYSLIEAENFSSKSGSYLKVEACPDGGQSVGGTNDNQYLEYNSIDFGSGVNGATKFSARLSVKGSNAGGNIEIRLDSPTGPLAGTLTVSATAADNWNVYQTQSTDIANVTGVHDVYLVFKVAAGKTYVANLNWFQFSKTLNSIDITKQPTKKVYSIGESLDTTGMVVTGTYIDGTTRVEEVRSSDVSGFNSSTAVASQTLTVNVRGKTATYNIAVDGKSAYTLTEAENFSSKSGDYLKVEACPDGGQSVGGTNDNQYLVYNKIDFGSGVNGATKFSARLSVKGSNAGGNIEIRLDSPTGPLAGTLTVSATAADNWNVYQTQSTDIANVTGIHDVYLVLKVAAGKTYVANLNWFQFSKTLNSISITKPPAKTVYRIGESLDTTGMVVTGTYIDGTTRVEEVRSSDVSGFNSSTAAAAQKLTINVRGKTATFTVDIKPRNLTSITAPAAITGVINGTAPTAVALGLPSTVVMVTDDGNVNAPVTWNIAASGYDPSVKTEQSFKVTGTVDQPSDVTNPNNVALSTSINVTVLASTTPDRDTSYKFSFMSISDTHANTPGDFADVSLNNALQDAIGNNVQNVSVVGDLTDYGTDAEYNLFMNRMNKYPQLNANYVLGNHDVRWLQGGYDTAKSRFLTHTGMPNTYYDKWINGYHFIYLATETDDKDSAYLSDTQLQWLNDKLAEGASKDKPIFLFLHQPLDNTVYQEYPWDPYQSDAVQDQKLEDIIGKYPQSLLITGHIHYPLTLPGTFYNKQYFSMVRDGAVKDSGQGLIVDVYADRVVLNGRDFNTKSTVTKWTINNYTADALAADKQAPTAPTNVTTKVLTDKMVNLSWDVATDNFKGNVGVTGYDIYNGDTLIGSTTGRTNFKVTGLTPNTTYQFTVKAKDEAGNISESSSPLKVTTLGYDPAPVNLALNKTVTSNGSIAGYEPSKAVDGSAASGSKWSSNTNGDKWLMVDLGENYDISRWVVKHAGEGGETLSLNTKNYKLQGSLDGTVWSDLDSVEGNVSNSTDRYIPKTNVRYVRLYITTPQNANETGTANIYEFEVYGRSADVQPPVTTVTTDGVTGDGAWNSRDVNVKFTAEDDPNGTGVNRIETRVDGGDWTNKTELTLTTDGMHSIEYRAIDNAGNVEAVKHLAIGIDKTAPEISVSVPGDGSIYENSSDLTPEFALADNLSGVDNSKTMVTLDTNFYKIGTTIPLYTLPLGPHTLVISSIDQAGNMGSKTVHFQTVASIDSLKALVTRFVDTKWIDNAGISNSLQAKLANNDLNSFVNEVNAQNGKHISSVAATYLLRDAQYVLSQQ